MWQPPPIKNVMYFPPMTNDGVVRVPCGMSRCAYPAGADFEGRLSYPPIHQLPCWLAGCSLLRAVGLSPYVGWLSNAEPVLCQPLIPSSKSNTQLSLVFMISGVKPSLCNPVENRIVNSSFMKADPNSLLLQLVPGWIYIRNFFLKIVTSWPYNFHLRILNLLS